MNWQNSGGREVVNQHPVMVGSIAGGFLLMSLFLVFRPSRTNNYPQAAFSIDDGKSYFVDSAKKVPPFTKSGTDAVSAMVFMGTDGKPFVGYLLKYTPSGKVKRETEVMSKEPMAMMIPSLAPYQVKKPGDKDWVLPPFFGGPPPKNGKPSSYDLVVDVRGTDGKPAMAISVP